MRRIKARSGVSWETGLPVKISHVLVCCICLLREGLGIFLGISENSWNYYVLKTKSDDNFNRIVSRERIICRQQTCSILKFGWYSFYELHCNSTTLSCISYFQRIIHRFLSYLGMLRDQIAQESFDTNWLSNRHAISIHSDGLLDTWLKR